MVHKRDTEILRGLYKFAAFTIQAVYFLQSGEYIRGKNELIKKAEVSERKILENAAKLKLSSEIGSEDFERLSEDLFQWAKNIIHGF